MSKNYANSKEDRIEATILLAKRLSSANNPVFISSSFLDALSESLLYSRRICFTGLGQYNRQQD